MSILASGLTGFLGRGVTARAERPVAILRGAGPRFEARLAALQALNPTTQGIGGDVRRPLAGLTPATLHDLAGSVTAVVHLAAHTNWSLPWPRLHETNVEGARTMVSVAHVLGVPLVHVSSSYAAFRLSGTVTGDLTEPSELLTKYERSKLMGELAVEFEAHRLKVPTTIIRFPGLVASPADGTGDTASLAAMIEFLDPPILLHAREARVDLLPRRFAVDAILEAVATPPSDGVRRQQFSLGTQAPAVAAVVAEAALRQKASGQRPRRALAVPAARLMSASRLADRMSASPRATLGIGLRYFASSAVYRSNRTYAIPMTEIVEALGHIEPQLVDALPGFYAGWSS